VGISNVWPVPAFSHPFSLVADSRFSENPVKAFHTESTGVTGATLTSQISGMLPAPVFPVTPVLKCVFGNGKKPEKLRIKRLLEPDLLVRPLRGGGLGT
jgi:hypothetical protein